MLEIFTGQLARGQALTDEEVAVAGEQLIAEAILPQIKADFLAQLARKGETIQEIAAFARYLRSKSVLPPIAPAWRAAHEILDVCGTGGDRLNTFNISTTVALVCSAAGVAVAKHGNRAITSQAGSADVLEGLGIRIDLTPAEAAQSLQQRHFAFFFAPHYHPAFKHLAPARKLCAEKGQRTIFNFLGPLLNPARPSAQLIGVPRPELCEPVARVLQSLEARRGMVVSGEVSAAQREGEAPAAFLDEFSTFGRNTIAEFYQERGFSCSVLEANGFPVQRGTLGDLVGGDKQANAGITRAILEGKERGPKRDAVLLNAAAALMVANRVKSLMAGWDLAAAVIDDGQALQQLEQLRS